MVLSVLHLPCMQTFEKQPATHTKVDKLRDATGIESPVPKELRER